jgi:hypothetical protein
VLYTAKVSWQDVSPNTETQTILIQAADPDHDTQRLGAPAILVAMASHSGDGGECPQNQEEEGETIRQRKRRHQRENKQELLLHQQRLQGTSETRQQRRRRQRDHLQGTRRLQGTFDAQAAAEWMQKRFQAGLDEVPEVPEEPEPEVPEVLEEPEDEVPREPDDQPAGTAPWHCPTPDSFEKDQVRDDLREDAVPM